MLLQICVRFWRAVMQGFLPTATEMAESVEDTIMEMAGEQNHIQVRGVTCFEALWLCNHVLIRDRDAPVQHQQRGKE